MPVYEPSGCQRWPRLKSAQLKAGWSSVASREVAVAPSPRVSSSHEWSCGFRTARVPVDLCELAPSRMESRVRKI